MSSKLPDVVLFDGLCNLCSRSVQFIIKHERAEVLQFAAVQSPAGVRLLKSVGLDPKDVKTFVLIADGRPYVKSDAAIRVATRFRGAWSLLAFFRIVPRPIRDWMYDVVATKRYQWFGRRETCFVPTPELAARFINE